MINNAAENTAGRTVAGREKDRDKDREKVEKRRALGRGLESLLPGPRLASPGAVRRELESREQVPHFVQQGEPNLGGSHLSSPVSSPAVSTVVEKPLGEPVAGFIRAEVEEDEVSRAGTPAPHDIPPHNMAELRSAGQPRPAVPTQTLPAQTLPTQTFPTETFPGGDSVDNSDETITIYAQAESRMPGNLVINLAIADLDKNPFQTRYVEDDDKLEELAESIKANGVVQPIMVRPGEEDGRYILVLGERRLLASKKAGKTHIPAMVRRVSLQQAAEMTIVENLQREDLSALEQAEAFRVLSNEFHLTQQQIGERVGLSRASITNYMRLLKLPREVMQLLAEKRINFAQARELLKLEGDDKIAEAALFAVKKGMTVEQVEMLVLRMNGLLDPIPGMPGLTTERKTTGARWVDPNVRAAQMELERTLGVRVRIRDRKGKGKIVIEYHTVDDYERVVAMLRGKTG